MHLNKGVAPFTLVAFDKNEDGLQQPIGTACIKKGGMGNYESDALWLAAVFVIEAKRGKGIASALIKECIVYAKQLDTDKIMLFTRTNGHLYEKFGWVTLEEKTYQGTKVKIMSKTLKP